jgi:hypothetical protein
MNNEKPFDPSKYRPEYFRAAFAPSKLWWDLQDVFEEFGVAMNLLRRLPDYWSQSENKQKVNSEYIWTSKKAIAKTYPSLESCMILCNFGRAPEGAALTRRIWETRLHIEFIITNKDLLSFIYNREPTITALRRVYKIRQSPHRKFAPLKEDDDKRIEKLPHKFQDLVRQFKDADFEPPKDEEELAYKYKSEWFGQNNKDLLKNVCQSESTPVELCISLWRSYVWDYSALNELTHAIGMHDSIMRIKDADGEKYYVAPSAIGVDTVLYSALDYTLRLIGALERLVGIPVDGALGEELATFANTVNELCNKYCGNAITTFSTRANRNHGGRKHI